MITSSSSLARCCSRPPPGLSYGEGEFVMAIVRLVVFYLVLGGLVSGVQWGMSPCRGADSPPLAVSMSADPANPAIMHASYLKNVAFWLPNLVNQVILGKMPVGEFFTAKQCYTSGAV
jgi:hypothetical protein